MSRKISYGSIERFKLCLSRIWIQTRKDMKIFFGSKTEVIVTFLLPPIILLTYSFLFIQSTSVNDSLDIILITYDSNAYFDYDNQSQIITNRTIRTYYDNYSASYKDAVEQSDLEILHYYNATEETDAMEIARDMLRDGTIKAIIVIPVRFSEMIIWGQPTTIECLIDISREEVQPIVNALLESITIFEEDNDLEPTVELDQETEYDIPEGYNPDFNWAMIAMISTALFTMTTRLSLFNIVSDKQVGRYLLSPAKKWEVLTGKYIGWLFLLSILVFIYTAVVIIGGLYVAGSVVDLYLALFVTGLVGLCLGTAIGANSKTKEEANQISLASFFIIFLLSGIFIPIDAMPPLMRAIALVLPLHHGEVLVRSIASKGGALLCFSFYWLLVLSAILFALAYVLYYKREFEV